MATFTVICVYNSKATLDKYLAPGLARQSVSVDLRLLNNTNGRFSSAAEALNEGARGASSDYLVFVHQDVELLSPTFFHDAASHLTGLSDVGIAGIVGATPDRYTRRLRGNCLQGDAPDTNAELQLERATPVQTLDEMLLIVPTPVFQQLQFDASTCPAWDLYGVDYALTCRERGYGVYAIPLRVRHASWGKLRWGYYQSLSRLLSKHKHVRRIYTTCGVWDTAMPSFGNWLTHKGRAIAHKVGRRTRRVF